MERQSAVKAGVMYLTIRIAVVSCACVFVNHWFACVEHFVAVCAALHLPLSLAKVKGCPMCVGLQSRGRVSLNSSLTKHQPIQALHQLAKWQVRDTMEVNIRYQFCLRKYIRMNQCRHNLASCLLARRYRAGTE
jgi:hypothetical protein